MNTTFLTIRPISENDVSEWGRMRTALWPDCPAEENAQEAQNYFKGGDLKLVLVALIGSEYVGFAEISERNIVDGCDDGPAAYLEGWFVERRFRKQGIGGALLNSAAKWAADQGYDWMGSDAELHNQNSIAAHAALGFEETGRIVTFRRRVGA